MKKLTIALAALCFSGSLLASDFLCVGSGFRIEVRFNPEAVLFTGNGYDAQASNVRIESMFETSITGNIANPLSTFKLVIKDGAGANGSLRLSSSNGTKNFSNLNCSNI